MCHYRRLVYACHHFITGPCMGFCDAQHRRETEADLKGEKAAPCGHFSFHPLHSISTTHLCQPCESEKKVTDALISRARYILAGLRTRIGQKSEEEGNGAEEASVCSLDIADAIARDGYLG
ncbi:hypothetical protein LMH87_011456 [Akanthomyces muscarius]|uniref:Uncharacterized protein n=1 Tax=Akanthomyces muscarius TaxID=2231603 RepID=A0A9W8Q977_AKAMU|nr:hypothetical protein LMH87_011456 [Akanthomyces muscarius]KAJ4150719.1 hypothetical protein LMH87_011456 [Akanthomyces muscarius]